MDRRMLALLLSLSGCGKPTPVAPPSDGIDGTDVPTDTGTDIPPDTDGPLFLEGDWGDLWTAPDGPLLVRSAEPGDDLLDDGFGRPVRPRLHRIGADGVTRLTTRADLTVVPFAGGALFLDLALSLPTLVHLDADGGTTPILEGARFWAVLGGAAWASSPDWANHVLYAPAFGPPVSTGAFVPWHADPGLRCVVGWNDGQIELRDLVAGTVAPVPLPYVDGAQAIVASDCSRITVGSGDRLSVRGEDGIWRELSGDAPRGGLVQTQDPDTLVAAYDGVWWLDLDAGVVTEVGEGSGALARGASRWLLGVGPHEAYCYRIGSLDLATGALSVSEHQTCLEIIGYGSLDGGDDLAQWASPQGWGMLARTDDPAGGRVFCESCLHPGDVSDDGAWLAVPDVGAGDGWRAMNLVSTDTLETITLAEGASYDGYWNERVRWWGDRLVFGVETTEHPWPVGLCPSALYVVDPNAPATQEALGRDVVDVEVDATGTLAFVVGAPRLEGACPTWTADPDAPAGLHVRYP